jgi:nucleotide-binding universal stress UspA family protein
MQYLASIVVPLDGSPFAEHALPLAVQLATAWKSRLHLVTVHTPATTWNQGGEFPTFDPDLDQELRRQEANRLQAIAQRIGVESDIGVDTEVIDGPVGEALEKFVGQVRADLVVLTSHGRGGIARVVLGNTADLLVHRLSVPVLVIRPGHEVPPGSLRRRMLVPLDGSALAESIMEQAKTMARATRSDLLLAMILTPLPVLLPPFVWAPEVLEESPEIRERAGHTYLELWKKQLSEEGFDVDIQVRTARKVAKEILQLAKDEECSVIAMATHGASGLDRAILGSVTDQVLRHADIPILVLRPVPGADTASKLGSGVRETAHAPA